MKKILFLIMLPLLLPVTGYATILTVSSGSDSGSGSLRDIIVSASSGDEIIFDADYTITLTSSLDILNKSLTIDGRDKAIVLDGNNLISILQLNSNATANVVLKNLTFQHGNNSSGSGGALSVGNASTNLRIDVSGCKFIENNAISGGAIYIGSGTATFTRCKITGNTSEQGGGLYVNSGTLNVVECNISENKALNTTTSHGGGIYNRAAVLNIRQSTIDKNEAGHDTSIGSGGGIYSASTALAHDLRLNSITLNISDGDGGGIANLSTALLVLYHNTVMGNQSSSGDGGGIFAACQVTLGANIIVGNNSHDLSTYDLKYDNPSVTNNEHNIFGRNTTTGLTIGLDDVQLSSNQLESVFPGSISLSTRLFTPILTLFSNGTQGVVPNLLNTVLIVPDNKGFLESGAADLRDRRIYSNQAGLICAGAINLYLPPSITSQRISDLSICEGSSFMYSVTATGYNLSYQWYLNNAPIAGATQASYGTSSITDRQRGSYYVIVSGEDENSPVQAQTQSQKATIDVLTAPAFVKDLESASICLGSTHTLHPKVNGSKLTYQWYMDGEPIPGREGLDSKYTIQNARWYRDYAYLKVAVSGVCGSTIMSKEARIWITYPLAADIGFTSLIGTAEPDKSYSVKLDYLNAGVPVYKWSYSNESAYFKEEKTDSNENTFQTGHHLQPGTISVELEHVCGNRIITQNVKTAGGGSGIDEMELHALKVYPNPVAGILYISSGSQADNILSVAVTDTNGRLVYQTQLHTPECQLPATEWPAGVYFVKVKTTTGTAVKKVIKN